MHSKGIDDGVVRKEKKNENIKVINSKKEYNVISPMPILIKELKMLSWLVWVLVALSFAM